MSDMAEVTELFEQIRRHKLENQSFAALNSLQCTACLNSHRKKTTGERHIKKEDSSLVREFEGYLQTVMDSLSNQLSKNLTPTEKQIEVLKSKFFLTDVCFEKAVEILSETFVRGQENSLV